MTQQDRFFQHLQFEKRYSPYTITSYKSDLKQFSEFLLREFELIDLSDADGAMIRSWLVFLINSGLSTRTVNRKLSSLKSFYHFLMREGRILNSPLVKVSAPKTSKRLPVFVDEENMLKLFDVTLEKKNYDDYRNAMILEVFYATGMRLSELIGLKEQDLDLHNCTLRVLGKRNKERIIPFGQHLLKALKEYVFYKQSTIFLVEDAKTFLFVTKEGKKLYPRLVYRIINAYLEQLTKIDKKSPHVLRHTFATHMLNRGASLNGIKEILGHANLSATQVYTHNSIDKLMKIYQQAHPKA